MHFINFSHPLTPSQRSRIEELTGQPIERISDVPTQFDPARPFTDQAAELVNTVGLMPQEWQALPLLINLPSLSVIAAMVLAELHGRMGYFPAILRLRPVAGSTPPQYEVAELVNLQAIRENARAKRNMDTKQ